MKYNEKQLQIMHEAESLFAEKGFKGASVRDIAVKAGINLAMVSYYFGSKEKLLEAIFEYRGEITQLKLSSILEIKELSAMEKVNLLVDNYIEKLMLQQNFHRILVREQVLHNTGVTSRLIFQMKKRNHDLINKLIREGQKNGEFIKNVDVPLMMTTLVGIASHLITTKHYYRQLSNQQYLTDKMFNNLIQDKLSKHLKFITKAILTHEI
ncbi:MAG TPA: TetR family transcriptional regulator [Chitinophagaceae bacterium]|jgi:AcrR family transcriptional regulator|nr:TetR family transcriptional regulator [Chitinophagaceae bacterium]